MRVSSLFAVCMDIHIRQKNGKWSGKGVGMEQKFILTVPYNEKLSFFVFYLLHTLISALTSQYMKVYQYRCLFFPLLYHSYRHQTKFIINKKLIKQNCILIIPFACALFVQDVFWNPKSRNARKWPNGGIINLLFNTLTYNTCENFAYKSYATRKISARVVC